MTVATGYLGARAFHGALATHSPFTQRRVMCVVCSPWIGNTIQILDEICDACYRLGWRPPHELAPTG